MESSDDASRSGVAGQMKELFDCPQCYESMLEKQSVKTDCDHVFCLECLVGWQKQCHITKRAFTCPVCTAEIGTYDPFHWPQRLLRNVFDVGSQVDNRLRDQRTRMEALENESAAQREQLAAIERERNRLRDDSARIEGEMSRDRSALVELQGVLDEYRRAQEQTLRSKDVEMARLREEIVAMEDRRSSEAELEAARQRMRSLEEEQRDHASHEATLQERVRSLEDALVSHREELARKEREMVDLQLLRNEIVAEGNQEEASELGDVDSSIASPLYDSIATGGKWMRSVWSSPLVSGSVHQSGRAINYVSRLVRKSLLSTGRHAPLRLQEKDYVLRERRGNHVHSPVFHAWHVVDGDENQDGDEKVSVAIKFRQRTRDAGREAMLLHQLSHPNCISLLGVCESPRGIGLVMPFVPYDLEWLMASEKRGLLVRERDRLCLQLLSAVAYIHAQEVVHRSISPPAVLLSKGSDGLTLHARLASWGSAASVTDGVKLPHVTQRSTRYMSPELIAGGAESVENWKAVDVWAAGATLWEVACCGNKGGTGALPLIAEGSQNPSLLMKSLLAWSEFHQAASSSRAPQPLVSNLLQHAAPPLQSLRSVAETELVPESLETLLLQMLQWESSARPRILDVSLNPYFALFRENQPEGRYVSNLRELSEEALDEWMRLHLGESE